MDFHIEEMVEGKSISLKIITYKCKEAQVLIVFNSAFVICNSLPSEKTETVGAAISNRKILC